MDYVHTVVSWLCGHDSDDGTVNWREQNVGETVVTDIHGVILDVVIEHKNALCHKCRSTGIVLD